jgi:hypothetical protein
MGYEYMYIHTQIYKDITNLNFSFAFVKIGVRPSP